MGKQGILFARGPLSVNSYSYGCLLKGEFAVPSREELWAVLLNSFPNTEECDRVLRDMQENLNKEKQGTLFEDKL